MIRSLPISSISTGSRQPGLAPLWQQIRRVGPTRHSVTQCMAACTARTLSMDAKHGQQQTNVMHLLADAHCHPQLDPANMHEVLNLQACHLAAMSVSYDVDWEVMLQLHKLAGHKIIPGFGIHPWWSHLHASSHGSTWQQLLEAPSQEQQQAAIDVLAHDDPVTNSGAYATNRPEKPDSQHLGQQQQQQQATNNKTNGSKDSSAKAFTGLQSGSNPQRQQEEAHLGNGLRVVPVVEWEGRLRQLLTQVPTAIVGEIGVDRSATIPGSRAHTALQHQMELVQRQVSIAAEFNRPVSVHCVRGYGHLLDFFATLSQHPQQCPPRVMLHSYGGSVEDIPRFYKLPSIGDRFYYSFSHAINHRTPDKLKARIAAVPDDRLLIESDQVTPLVIDGGMMQICQTVSEVKGWGLQDTAQRMLSNFKDFYQGQLIEAD